MAIGKRSQPRLPAWRWQNPSRADGTADSRDCRQNSSPPAAARRTLARCPAHRIRLQQKMLLEFSVFSGFFHTLTHSMCLFQVRCSLLEMYTIFKYRIFKFQIGITPQGSGRDRCLYSAALQQMSVQCSTATDVYTVQHCNRCLYSAVSVVNVFSMMQDACVKPAVSEDVLLTNLNRRMLRSVQRPPASKVPTRHHKYRHVIKGTDTPSKVRTRHQKYRHTIKSTDTPSKVPTRH